MENRLREAAIEGSVTSLIILLNEDPLILDRIIVACVKETPLHIAAMLGHVDFVKEIVSRKPELVKEVDVQRSSPLHLAAAKGYMDIVKELLHINSDVCLAQDQAGRTPIHLAAIKGHMDVMKELFLARPEATQARLGRGETILHLCVKCNRLESLKLLMELMGDDHEFMNCRDVDGNTVLHLAVVEKKIEITKVLLSNTRIEMINALNTNGFTPLEILARRTPRDLKDIEIGDSLIQAAGALLSKHNIQSTSIETRVTRATATDMTYDSYTLAQSSCYNEWEHNNLGKHEYWLKKKKNTLMVVASLMATMSFQAGVNPPGGVWQGDDHSSWKPHKAGWSVMADKYSASYKKFLVLNTLGFLASLSIILLLISGLPVKKRIFMWILMVITWVAITSMAIAYIIAISVVTPDKEFKQLFYSVFVSSFAAGLGLMGLIILAHTIRFIVRSVRRFKTLPRRARKLRFMFFLLV